jgi:hypothetical protein
LDETQLDFAMFVLPRHRHFIFDLFDVSNSIWSKELQNKPRYDERSTDPLRKGGILRGNKVVNYKSLKTNDLQENLLEPSGSNKNNE